MVARMKRLSAALAVLAIAAMTAFSPARADELQDISKMLRGGQHAQALERINKYLSGKPKDPQGRFLKGLILAEQNKSAEAIDVFTKLSQDYPELPEPYNNVAVLYAAQGQYEKARQALEMSIRTHPAYATAYENLGDVYTKLASQAYDKALQLDSSNSNAQSKLALMKEMISGTKGNVKPPAPVARAAEPAKAAPTVIAQAPAQKSAPAAAKAAEEPAAPPARAAAGGQDEVVKTVRGWAQAWSSKNVNGYLGYYAKDFKPPKGEARASWEAGRRQRIMAPKQIEVSVDAPRVRMNGDRASVTFRQHYRSDSLKTSSTKTLELVKVDGKWLIREERVGG
jgi:tetratricopeptide (TPR) repeat protein